MTGTGWKNGRRFIAAASALGAMLGALFFAGASGAQQVNTPQSVADLGQSLFLGKALVVQNVTAWPVYATKPVLEVSQDFVTLADAQDRKQAVIREKGARAHAAARSQGRAQPQQQLAGPAGDEPQGTVNELVIENRGKKPILVLAGTLLKGGKQDRQVGQDFIVPPGKTVPVEAFCVEQGRWTARREGKHTGGVFRAKKSLAAKGVRSSGQFKKDQRQVWRKVAGENRKAGKAPSSGTLMAAVEETDQQAVARRKRMLGALSGHFVDLAKASKAPVGFAYAVDGRIKEVRTFTHPLIFQRFFETLFNTVAMEADLAQREAVARKRPIYRKRADSDQVVDLVRGASKIRKRRSRSKAGSVIEERKSDKIWNADCYEGDDAKAPATRSFMLAE